MEESFLSDTVNIHVHKIRSLKEKIEMDPIRLNAWRWMKA